MARRIRYNTVRDLDDLSNLLDVWGRTLPSRSSRGHWGLALDVLETHDEFIVKASIPGLNLDEIEITYSDNILTLRGELTEADLEEGEKVHLRERRHGKFVRSLRFSTEIEVDDIEAKYEAGILTIILPKAEVVKPKRIVVKPGEKTKVIEGEFENITSKN